MQQEGEDKLIALRGIERAAKSTISADGAMNEVIGMIARNNSYVPYSPTDMGLNRANDIKMIRIHHTSTGDNVIVVRSENSLTGDGKHYKIQYSDKTQYDDNGYCSYTLTTIQRTVSKKAAAVASTESVISTTATEETTPVYSEGSVALYTEVRNIVFIGNRMIIETDNGIEYFLWENGAYTRQTGGENVNNYVLPTVEFKVEAGILGQDGVKHKFAQTVRVEDTYDTEKETPKKGLANPKGEAEYARSTKNMGSDALALISSIQYNGGITGYVLVTAAYHLKASAGKDNEYIPAGPIVLMGAPTMEQKKGEVVSASTEQYGNREIELPNIDNNAYMIDVFDYASSITKYCISEFDTASYAREQISGISSQKACSEALNEAESTGTSSEEGSDYNTIQYDNDDKLVGSKNTTLRKAAKINGKYMAQQGFYTRGDDMWLPESSKETINTPALFGCKYGTYYHPKRTGTDDSGATNKGFRILRGTGNVLSIKINSKIDDKYKDEIDKLVLFMSPIISPFVTDTNGQDIKMVSTLPKEYNTFKGFFFDESSCNGNWMRRRSSCGGGFIPQMKSDKKLREEINNIASLYAVHEISYSDLQKEVGDWKEIQFGAGELITENIVEQTAINLSDLYKVDIIKGHIFGYNERLHIYDYTKSTIQRVQYKGLSYYGSIGVGQYGAGTAGTFHFAVMVTDKNKSKVVATFDSIYPAINPLLSYPDTDATNIRVIKYYQQGTKYYLGYKDFTPEKFKTTISTYYVNGDLSPINIAVQEVTQREYDNAVPEELLEQDSQTYGRNEIRVSGTGDTIFKSDKNYKVGNGEIIGLARLTMSLSQDNYGRFPLLIFTTDGIYTLEVDSTGTHAYTEQAPLSRVICTNKNSICELDDAVLFATEYGLMLATTAGVKAFAPQVNGKPNNTPDDKTGLTMYKNAVAHEKIVELTDSISQEDFVEYIQANDTYIRYLHAINSVVIYNPTKTYSYIIDLQTIVCTKIEQQIRLDDNDFPKQTFYIQPKVQTEIVQVRYTTNSQKVTTSERIYIEDAIAEIDVEALLKTYFTNSILQQLEDFSDENADKWLENGEMLTGNREWYDYCEEQDEDWFEENYQKDKATVLQEIDDETTRLEDMDDQYTAKDEAIREARRDFTNETAGADEKIDALGIKSLTTLYKEEAEGKADYTTLRENLRQEEIAKQYGVVNTATLDFPVGTTTLTKQADGTWKYGNSTVANQRLTELGLTPATVMVTGDLYIITTTNKNYPAVQFDYYTGSDSTQCLLQSRPIKLDSQYMKAAYRVVVRGTFGKTEGFTITSKQHNTFTVVDKDKLLQCCMKQSLTFYYKEVTTVVKPTTEDGESTEVKKWKWVEADGKEVTLKNYGIVQKTTIPKKQDTLTITLDQHYAGLYVFGSLDGEHWMPIGGTEKLLSYNRFHDLGCRTHRVGVRYLMVVFAGNLDTDCHIDDIEITDETRYNNKLK